MRSETSKIQNPNSTIINQMIRHQLTDPQASHAGVAMMSEFPARISTSVAPAVKFQTT